MKAKKIRSKLNLTRKQSIVNEIRKKYSVNDELAILRQRAVKVAEFEEYNYYVEECKLKFIH